MEMWLDGFLPATHGVTQCLSQSPRSVIPLPTGSVQRPARPEPCLGLLLVENNIREPRQAGSVVRDAPLGSRAGPLPQHLPSATSTW